MKHMENQSHIVWIEMT